MAKKTKPLVPHPGPYTWADLHECVKRELEHRRSCYPRWVKNHEDYEALPPELRWQYDQSVFRRVRLNRAEAERQLGMMEMLVNVAANVVLLEKQGSGAPFAKLTIGTPPEQWQTMTGMDLTVEGGGQ